uniref:Uncharacterized protein n=1 Tax=Caenorhabditis japonica TaxID=281687 RepID=A0A8R1ETL4_CAEJA
MAVFQMEGRQDVRKDFSKIIERGRASEVHVRLRKIAGIPSGVVFTLALSLNKTHSITCGKKVMESGESRVLSGQCGVKPSSSVNTSEKNSENISALAALS